MDAISHENSVSILCLADLKIEFILDEIKNDEDSEHAFLTKSNINLYLYVNEKKS